MLKRQEEFKLEKQTLINSINHEQVEISKIQNIIINELRDELDQY